MIFVFLWQTICPLYGILGDVTNAWTKRPLKCTWYQSVKSPIWKVACWLGSTFPDLSIYLSKTLFWHLRNWFARFSSSWEPKEFESANRKKWKGQPQNGPINYLAKNKRDLSRNSRNEELINQLVPITVRSVAKRRKVIRCKRDLTLDVSYFKLRWLVNF